MRRRFFRFVMIGAAAVGLCGVSAGAQFPGSVAEQYLFNAANAERQQRGLEPLRWNGVLYKAAHGHALEMAARQSISHQYPGEAELSERGRAAGARFSVISENVAEAPTAVMIHDAWMKSPGHKANLLDPNVDSVGISVIRREGQLYAVQDFDRSVAALSLEQQESTVGALVSAASKVSVVETSEDAHKTCEMETGYAGTRRPWFVMRYTAGDLTRLPDALKTELETGRYHQAMVAACSPHEKQAFTTFNIAVLLYP